MYSKDVAEDLKAKFQQDIVEVVEFMDEITVEVRNSSLRNILSYLKDSPGPGYEVLMDLTGVDYLFPEKRTKVLYFMHNPSNLARLRIIVYVVRGQELPSVTDLWAGAAWYERELYDLFGVRFIDHPDLKRILLPDDWVGHPLRRDYKLTEEAVEFKHGVTPKIPSEIIPHE
jgi:NADH-quinone oxidoreductase subunit C